MEELAFVLASLKIFNSNKVAYLYHRDWKVYENLANGLYDGIEKNSLGFILAN